MKQEPDKETGKVREKDEPEDPYRFPGDVRPEWVKEDVVIEGRKPDLEETEEDESIL